MNVRENNYAVRAILPDGSVLDLTLALVHLSWQDPAEEVAQRASILLAQVKTERGWLNQLLPLCTAVQILANGAQVFSGIVWDWEYASANSRVIALTCYDPFIYAQHSKTFAYFPPGKSTEDIFARICGENGIPCKYQWQSATHDKLVFRGNCIADQLLDTLEEARRRLGQRYVVCFVDGVLTVQGEGANKDVYVFKATESAIHTAERMSMDGLVTQVAVYGAEDQEDRRQLEAVIPGRTEYGTLQQVVLLSASSKLSDAKKDAQGILAENGAPKHTITAKTPDVPCIRKGWKIKMEAGSLLGYYIVKGVTHNATDRTMVMELQLPQTQKKGEDV